MKVTRPPVRYYGGKWRIADWIISMFPPHTCYVEPFGGGASVLLRKSPARFEVLNDLDNDVVNFFAVLRTRPDALIRAILLTPYARLELRRAYRRVSDPLEAARRFYVRSWQSFGSGQGHQQTGWRYQIGNTVDSRASAIGSFNRTEHLWAVAERLKQVQIEHDDACKVIQRFDGPRTLFYIDPPYLHSTRHVDSVKKGYQHEMTEDQHRELAALLRSLHGMIIVSGYQSPLYDELYGDWQCVSRQVKDLSGKMRAIECLWLSPSATAYARLPLFSQGAEIEP